MAKTWWKKELVSNPFMAGGRIVPFEHLTNDVGVIVLDDEQEPDTVRELNASRGKRGIVSISEADYDEIKKKHPLLSSVKPSKPEKLRVLSPLVPSKPTANPAATDKPGDEATAPVTDNPPTPPPPAPTTSLPFVPKRGRPRVVKPAQPESPNQNVIVTP